MVIHLDNKIESILNTRESASFILAESGEYALTTMLSRIGTTLNVVATLKEGSRILSTYRCATTISLNKLASAADKISYLKSVISSRTDTCKIASWLAEPIKHMSNFSGTDILPRIHMFVQVTNMAEEYNLWAFKTNVEHITTYLRYKYPVGEDVSAGQINYISHVGELKSRFDALSIFGYRESSGICVEVGDHAFVFRLQDDGTYTRTNKTSPIYKRSQLAKQIQS